MVDWKPTWPELEWESAPPETLGANPAALNAAARTLARSGSNASAFVVVKSGRLIWEQYYYGFDAGDRHHLFSITKSFLSALVGLALAEGVLEGIDQPVLDFFPEFPRNAANPMTLVTVRHLLSMTSGIVWPRGSGGREPMVERLRRSPDWTQFILGLPVRREEIGQFHYCSAASHLLSAVLTRATGLSACEFAHPRLFTPIGIRAVNPGSDWETDPGGVSLGGWGLHLTAREVARFGWLYACGGQWHGQPLIPESWVNESTLPPGGSPTGYGYQWWRRTVGRDPVIAGLGVGGQYLFCIPARQLVVVILSRFVHHWPDRWEWLAALLADG